MEMELNTAQGELRSLEGNELVPLLPPVSHAWEA